MARIVVGFDVGNSTVKAGWFQRGSVEGVRTARHHSSEMIEEFVDVALSDRPFDAAVIATVNSSASSRLVEALERRSIPVVRVYQSDGSLFDEGHIGCGVDTPRTTGVDRLLAVLAALRRSPGENVAVVTCGSAITINLATKDGVFHGGAILPGVAMMARSLHSETAALPRISPPAPTGLGPAEGFDWPIPTMPGRSTITAMRAGVFFAAVGAVERLLDELRPAADPFIVHVTGGDGEFLCRALRRPHLFSPSLVLEGLAEVMARRSKAEPPSHD